MAAAKRITGRALQRIRRAHFARNPFCVSCKAKNGFLRLATELDHIVALDNGGEESLDPFVNRQGLCSRCHKIKTNADLGRKETGCDVYGNPTNPLHPWNLAKETG